MHSLVITIMLLAGCRAPIGAPAAGPPATTPQPLSARESAAWDHTGPLDLVGAGGGAILFRTARRSDAVGAVLTAQRLDAEGRGVGEPSIVVEQLGGRSRRVQATTTAAGAAVAWCSVTDSDERFGLVFTDNRGERTAAVDAQALHPDVALRGRSLHPDIHLPRGLDDAAAPGCNVEIIGTDGDELVIVTQSARGRCVDISTEREVSCSLFAILRITPDREVRTIASGGNFASVDVRLSPVVTEGCLQLLLAQCEGRSPAPERTCLDLRTAPRWANDPPCPGGGGYAEMTVNDARQFYTGAALIFVGFNTRHGDLRAYGYDPAAPPDQHIRALYSFDGIYPRLVGANTECVGGRPQFAWQLSHPRRERSYRFDPFAAGASFRWVDLLRGSAADDAAPEAAAWTGRSLLVVRRDAAGELEVTATRCDSRHSPPKAPLQRSLPSL